MGYAFTLPLFKYFGGSRTASYVHYPTISTDMLDAVSVRRAAHNNRAFIANSRMATWAKTVYYKLFAWTYGWCGRCSDLTVVNSSWTSGHVSRIWFGGDETEVHKIFPPCDTQELEDIVRTPDEEGDHEEEAGIAQTNANFKKQRLEVLEPSFSLCRSLPHPVSRPVSSREGPRSPDSRAGETQGRVDRGGTGGRAPVGPGQARLGRRGTEPRRRGKGRRSEKPVQASGRGRQRRVQGYWGV